jgi:hypothetical protein
VPVSVTVVFVEITCTDSLLLQKVVCNASVVKDKHAAKTLKMVVISEKTVLLYTNVNTWYFDDSFCRS